MMKMTHDWPARSGRPRVTQNAAGVHQLRYWRRICRFRIAVTSPRRRVSPLPSPEM
jgi:hypothetical protein